MVEKGKHLIVVAVLEGRNFPKRNKNQLVVEAKFDGELLSTDNVEHVENPEFTQELAWELDKKGLHQHRLQRTSIKVQVYAVDPSSTARECVGYVVLDLRSASTQKTYKWLSLLHSKYQKNKPEIRLGLYLDDDGKGDASFEAHRPPTRPPIKRGNVDGIDPALLRPILNDAEGFYQIGPADTCKDHFILSVTIAFATNLPQLIPTNIPLLSTGFFFYYSLLGNDVTNEVFHDIINPNFPAERASVRLQSDINILRMFFNHQPGIEIHLCAGDQSLGTCTVPLKTLLPAESTEIFMKPVTVEGSFQMHSVHKSKQQSPNSPKPATLQPTVGVAVSLRKEEMGSPSSGTPVKETVGQSPPTKQPASQSPKSKAVEPKQSKIPKGKGKASKSKKEVDKSPPASQEQPARGPSPLAPPTLDGSYTDTFDSASRADDNTTSLGDKVKQEAQKRGGAGEKKPTSTGDDAVRAATSALPPTALPPASTPPPSTHIPVMALDPPPAPIPFDAQRQVLQPPGGSPHHFCVSLDLRSFKAIALHHPSKVFVRYTYGFFGSAAPILTQPPVEASKGTEIHLPQSFCAFDFATVPSTIQETFSKVPLTLEVWEKETQKAQNTLLGTADLLLANIFAAECSHAVRPDGMSGSRRVWSETLPVITSTGAARRLGDLHVVLSLEDWGPIQTDPALAAAGYSAPQTTTSESDGSAPLPSNVGRKVVASDPRETVEYKAAMELEVWKAKQEALFTSQLEEKEKMYMAALAEEWKRRDKEREVLVHKKVSEYTQLEEKLRKTIADLDRRDKQLTANEKEVIQLRGDLQREHERKMSEMREASRRLKEDCDHQIQLEKAKTKELEEYIVRLKNQLSDAEIKVHALEKEFTHFKEQQNSKPEVRLQSEINLLTLEKVELERKLDAATKSKVHYKQQWGRALKELARLKQREQQAAKSALKKQQQELEHMRLRYLAAEEKEVVRSDNQTLSQIRQQLQDLKESDGLKTGLTGETDLNTGLSGQVLSDDDDHITRLIEERDTLLRTGVYTQEDRIIAELDSQIRQAIATRSNT